MNRNLPTHGLGRSGALAVLVTFALVLAVNPAQAQSPSVPTPTAIYSFQNSGTADIIYFASDAVHMYFNQSGNGWGARRVLDHFPSIESVSSATAVDLLGNGTACLVWSSALPGIVPAPARAA